VRQHDASDLVDQCIDVVTLHQFFFSCRRNVSISVLTLT